VSCISLRGFSPPLVTGRDVMVVLGLSPDPQVG
jgi:hypothetical protein